MSKEEYVKAPGDAEQEREVTLKGTEAGFSQGEANPESTYGFQWDNVPYAPPFNLTPGGSYPQLYQVPLSYLQPYPYRAYWNPGAADGGDASSPNINPQESRQIIPFFGISPFGPSFGIGVGIPLFFRPPFFSPFWW